MASLKVSPLLTAAMHSNPKGHSVESFPLSDSISHSASITAIFQGYSRRHSDVFTVGSQLNEVAAVKIYKCGPELDIVKFKRSENSFKVPDASSISAFMTQVTDLVKLVDSTDIVELQLKHLNCEVLIRKKEALPQQSIGHPVFKPPPTYKTLPPPAYKTMPPPLPLSPAPLVKVDKVQKGQLIGRTEAQKLMIEIIVVFMIDFVIWFCMNMLEHLILGF